MRVLGRFLEPMLLKALFYIMELGGFHFVPLIHQPHELVCSLDILTLRRERPGAIVDGGDIDNRLAARRGARHARALDIAWGAAKNLGTFLHRPAKLLGSRFRIGKSPLSVRGSSHLGGGDLLDYRVSGGPMKYPTPKIAPALLSVIALIVFTTSAALGSPIAVVDQENPGPFETTNGAFAPFSFGQSFTPTLPAIDAIEFLLGGDDSTIVVQLRESVAGADGLSGSIISQSLPVLVDLTGSHVFHFDFPTRVSVMPGQPYVAELLIATGSLGVRHTQGNVYADGQFLHQGFSPTVFSNTDLVFAEGIHAVNGPTTFTLVGLGWALLGLRRVVSIVAQRGDTVREGKACYESRVMFPS